MQEKLENNASNISLAFQDLKNLMDMAKDMVRLANIMSNKIKVFQLFYNYRAIGKNISEFRTAKAISAKTRL